MKKTYEQVVEACENNSIECGLNLDYDPKVKVEDIATLTTEEWTELRKTGIGGSDAGTVMKVNTHRTRTELAMDKLGKLPKKEVTASQQYIFDYGHQMEAALGNWFAASNGVSVSTDRRWYQHPFYPWMIINCDGFAVDKDGYRCLLEFKTANPMFKSYWKSGVLGEDAVLFRPEYEWQVRHGMAILNIYRAYIVVGFDNNADNIIVIQVDRDIQKEVALINEEADFWRNNVQKGIIPYETKYSKDSFENIRPATRANKTTARMALDETLRDSLQELVDLTAEKSKKNAELKKIEERLNAVKLPIEEAMGENVAGYLSISTDEEFAVTFNETTRDTISGDNLKALKMEAPDIYEKYHKQSVSRTLKADIKARRK